MSGSTWERLGAYGNSGMSGSVWERLGASRTVWEIGQRLGTSRSVRERLEDGFGTVWENALYVKIRGSRFIPENTHLGASGNVWERQGTFGSEYLGKSRISRSVWEYLGVSGSRWERLGASGSVWNVWERLGTSGSVWDRLEESGRV